MTVQAQLELELLVSLGPTGHCKWGRHDKCGPAGLGVRLTQGGTYRCPCACHQREVTA